MRFLFPFSSIPKESKVVIYGAGEAGYDFYRQLKTSEYAKIVLWADRQYEWFRRLNLPVDEPERISGAEYDYVVISAENRSVFESIRKDLIALGVPEIKLIWHDDYTIHENIVLGYKDRDIEAEMQNALKGNPVMFLTEDRLDIVIRYMYALEILKNMTGGYGEGLYRKFIEQGCGAKEPTENYISAYFSEYSYKSGIEAFRESFRKLVFSMKTDGFKKDQFLPMTNNGRLINGAHRVAAALACQKHIWYLSYPFNGLRYACDDKALHDMGFTDNDIKSIKEHYTEILDRGRE